MKKSLLALAMFGAFAGSASAQSAVTVYGVVDAGVVSESGNGATATKVSSGVQSESRLGFRGTEDLGNGVKAVFTLEADVGVDTGKSNSGSLFGRQSFVGLSSEKFGTLTMGNQLTSVYNTLHDVADPFQTGLAGSSLNLIAPLGESVGSSVKYATPTVAGFSGEVTYGMGEVPGDSKANRTVGGSAGYADKTMAVRVAVNKVEIGSTGLNARTTLLAGSYDLGVVKAHAGFADTKLDTLVDSRDLMIGATVPFGANKLLVSYIRKDDRTAFNADANQFAIGYTYDMSKRTNLYTSYAHISNKNGAGYTVGNASEAGSSDRAFNVGVRHAF
jgi:GBP family porin